VFSEVDADIMAQMTYSTVTYHQKTLKKFSTERTLMKLIHFPVIILKTFLRKFGV
jgi:hypothetical protein